MGAQLINPNFHVVLIHFPLGVFTLGMLIELGSFLYRKSTVRSAGRWMILIGVLSMIATSVSGVYALSDVARRSLPPGQHADVSWRDVTKNTELYNGKNSPTDEGEQWRLISGHVWRTAPATAIAVFSVILALALTDRWRRRLYIPILLVLLFSLATMFWGAWMGGEMVFRWKTAVQIDTPKAFPAMLQPTTAPGAAREQTELRTTKSVQYYVPALQTHGVVAGLAIAFALAAIGLSIRNAAGPAKVESEDEARLLNDTVTEPGHRPARTEDLAMLRSFKPDAAVYLPTVKLPAAKVFLVSALIAIGASLLGTWFLANGTDAFERAQQDHRSFITVMWETIKTQETPARISTSASAKSDVNPLGLNRRLAHVIAGSAIIVLPLILAMLARWAPRQKIVLGLFVVLLLLAIAAQIWLGTLMTLDTPAGSIFRFQDAALDPMVR